MNVRAERLPLVDALRAIAALAVLGTHTAVLAGAVGPGSTVSPYAQRLDVGVTVFFLISGLLLYRPFVLARLQGAPSPATGPYAWRRFLRIVPAYWLALTVTVLLFSTPGVFTADGIPTFYGLAQTYRTHTIGGGLTQGWTLTIEIAFYAFLPVYAWVQRRIPASTPRARLRAEIGGLVVLVVFSEIWKAVVLSSGDPNQIHVDPALDALPSFLDHFALGMGLALFGAWTRVSGRSPRWVATFDRAPIVSWVFAAVGFWFVSTRIGIDHFFAPVNTHQYIEKHFLYAAVAFGLLLPAAIGDQTRGLPRRILSWRVLGWLGLVSYGIYLWQGTVLEQLDRWNFGAHTPIHPYVGWGVVGTAATVAVAAVSYYALERPVLSLKNRVGRNPAPPGEPLTEPAPVTADAR